MGRISKRFSGFLRKSVKRAFVFYALIAALVGVALSVGETALLTSFADDIWAEETGATGVYIYSEEQHALVPAESFIWFEDGTALYVERTDADPTYFPSVSLENPSFDVSGMHVVDNDTGAPIFFSDGGAQETQGNQEPGSLNLDSITEYDAKMNAMRGGNADELARDLFDQIQDDIPAASFVGYYLYQEPSARYVALNLAALALVPVIVVVCMLVLARMFYRRHLQDPIALMDDAARRISQGDLDFHVEACEEGNELDRLCVSFETMRGELEANERRMWRSAENKRRADAALAHDLRTPVTVIKGQAEMLTLMAERDQLGGEAVLDAAQTIERQATRLEDYASSLREFDAIEAIEPHTKPVPLRTWFERMSADVSGVVSCRGLEFEAQFGANADKSEGDDGGFPEYVQVDAAIVERVIDNLVSNAARYAHAKVILSCAWGSGVLVVRVRDDGPGFAKEALSHAIEPYWRSNTGETRDGDGFPGSKQKGNATPHFGLGLNIASILCEKHGGKLVLNNASEGGADVEASFAAPLEPSSAEGEEDFSRS